MARAGRRPFLKGVVGVSTALTGCLRAEEVRSVNAGESLEGPHRLIVGDRSEEPTERFPIDLSCEFTDEQIEVGNPARLEATLRNTGDEPVTIHSDPVWPFGVPFLIRTDTEEFQRVTIWNDAFDESPHLRTTDRSVTAWDEVFIEEDVGAGETIQETYELYHDSPDISTGTYTSWVSVRAKEENVTDTSQISFDEIVIEPDPTD